MSRNLLFFIVLLVGCLTQFASDIYAPAVPEVAFSLDASLNLVQMSMAIYMLGVALTQILYGIASEGVGRKTPLLCGLVIMFAGSLICINATNIHTLIFGRLIQGCGAGACSSMWRSIFRDTFTGNDLAKYGSYLTSFIVFIIPLAPALGGYLSHYFTWRSVFVFLTAYTVIAVLFVIFSYQETSRHHHLERLKLPFIKSAFRELFQSSTFLGCSLSTFLTYGGLFAWLTSAPVLFIHLAGMKPVSFGWYLFLGGGSAYGISGVLNGKLVHRFGMIRMMQIGWSICFSSALLLLASHYTLGINLWAFAVSMWLFIFGSTLIFPNTNAIALTPFGKIVGVAGSTYGFIQVLGAAILGGLIAHIHEKNQIPIAILTTIAPILAWICLAITVQTSSKDENAVD